LTIRGRVLSKAKTLGKRNAARLNRRIAKEEVLYRREHRKPQGKPDPTASIVSACCLWQIFPAVPIVYSLLLTYLHVDSDTRV